MEGIESTDSDPTNDQTSEQNTSQSTSQMFVSRSYYSESEDWDSDLDDSLDSLTGSANSDNGRHCSSTSEKHLAVSILNAVCQKDKNRLLEVLKTCKENNFPQSRSINSTCRQALRLAASSQGHKECLELLLEYDNGVLVSLCNELIYFMQFMDYDFEEDINILLLLQKGYEFHKIGQSILHYAVRGGKSKMISLLSNQPVNINVKDSNGFTPLHLSIKTYCNLEGIRSLVENGADVLIADKSGDLPLHHAIRIYFRDSRTFNIVCLLVERDSTTINYPNNRGDTPFFCAVDGGKDVSFISYLLEKGARTVDAASGITAFQRAASRNHYHLLPILLESVPVSLIERYCSFDISSNIDVLKTSTGNPKSIVSLTCAAIDIGTDCLVDLMSRNLPEAVLQAPSVRYKSGSEYEVISPLAYLFSRYHVIRKEEFDSCLDILLKNKITMVDEFRSAHLFESSCDRFAYIDPFDQILDCCGIFESFVPHPEDLRYFNLLNANEVTIDYCLRCYHDNTKPFATFNKYRRYYAPVVSAARYGDGETLKLLISTSDILEPDILSGCVLSLVPKETYKNIRPKLEYLISLKPVYYKHYEDSFSSYSTASERFSQATLKGLCRTVIREQLRERTLEENLLNFRRKIFELPLPNLLKDYLLFKI